MQTVLDAWARWQGSFLAFCDHVREQLRVPFGREMIARILDIHGRRRRGRRERRRPDRKVVSAETNPAVVADCVDHALATQSPLERTFWIGSLAGVLRARDQAQRQPLFLAAARRIEATFAIGPRERHAAVRQLTDRLIPVA